MRSELVRRIHIELTTRCNAVCAMCARSPMGIPNDNLPLRELKAADVREMLPGRILATVEEVNCCGNFGDPSLASDLVPILQHFRDSNPQLDTIVHTNGGARSPAFWMRVAPLTTSVRFGIDGLSDTNHLYRQQVDWTALMKNASAFIEAGGRAEWVFTAFRHNEQQISQICDLARAMGFSSVVIRRTNRFGGRVNRDMSGLGPPVPVRLEPPRRRQLKNRSESITTELERKGELDHHRQTAPLGCSFEHAAEVYLDAHGRLFPCCYWGAAAHAPWRTEESDDVLEAINRVPGALDALSLRRHALPDVLASDLFMELPRAMTPGPGRNRMCAARCSGTLRLESEVIDLAT